jgi:hypothetical protein
VCGVLPLMSVYVQAKLGATRPSRTRLSSSAGVEPGLSKTLHWRRDRAAQGLHPGGGRQFSRIRLGGGWKERNQTEVFAICKQLPRRSWGKNGGHK